MEKNDTKSVELVNNAIVEVNFLDFIAIYY